MAFEPVVSGQAGWAGVPDPVIRRFAQRRAEVGEVLGQSDRTTAQAAQVAALAAGPRTADAGHGRRVVAVLAGRTGWRRAATFTAPTC